MGASHLVTIGGVDVSEDVTAIHSDQAVETDSDPSKVEIRLANRGSKYNDLWTMITTKFVIKVYNTRHGKAKETYHVAQGHLTDLSCDKEPGIAIVCGECEIGHLSDALPQTISLKSVSCYDVLTYFIDLHNADNPKTPIVLNYHALKKMMVSYDPSPGDTYQDVLDDMRDQTGAVFWMDEETNQLNFYDPYFFKGQAGDDGSAQSATSLDYRVSNPDQCLSVTGFANSSEISGNSSDVATGYEGDTTPQIDPLISVAQSIGVGGLPAMYAKFEDLPDTTTQEELDMLAQKRLDFFKLMKDALTEPIVHGMCPNLFELVEYTNPNWNPTGEDHVVKGVTTRKVLDYNESQFETKLAVSRGALALELIGEIIDMAPEE